MSKIIEQQKLSAQEALDCGLLTDGAEGCGWFAEWARKSPKDEVYLYRFGGFIGGMGFEGIVVVNSLRGAS